MLTIEVNCECENSKEISIVTTFCSLEEIVVSCRDYIDSTKCWLNIIPQMLQINVADFKFTFDIIVDANAVWSIPKKWNFEEYYNLDCDAAKWETFISAASVATKNKGKSKFPAMQGINVNCFSNIMEITASNKTICMYQYENATRISGHFNFTVSSDAIFALDTILLEDPCNNIQVKVDAEFIFLLMKTEFFSVSVTTPFIRGVYTYPKTPIHNVSQSRIPVSKLDLIEKLANKTKQYHKIDEESCFETPMDVLYNQINIKTDNNLVLIKAYNGETIEVLSLDKSLPDFSFWLDSWQLRDILENIGDEKIFFILPEREYQGLIIETDTCQYTLMTLVKGDRTHRASRSLGDPVYRKVLYSVPGASPSEPSMEIAITEFPLQEHVFEQWQVRERQYNPDCPVSWRISKTQHQEFESTAQNLYDNLDFLYKAICQKKNCEDRIIRTSIDELCEELQSLIEDENMDSETVQQFQISLKEGILLRGRLIENYLELEETHRVEMFFF
jgi:hypothetical protein